MNKVILIGRLTKDIEIKYTGNNLAIASFTVAVNRRYQKQNEERQADFINCKAFGKMAEFLEKYFSKGSMINVVGRLEISTWDDAEGKRHYFTNVMTEEINFCGGKSPGGNQKGDAYEPKQEQSNNQDAFYPVNDDDDELPF